MVKIAVVVYSVYGQVLALAEAEVKGLRDAGVEVDLYQLPTHDTVEASTKADLPVITPEILANYEGFLFGIPSRYGTHPFSFKEFVDSTGAQWQAGAYHGKFAGLFVSSGTQGGGQESVIRNTVTSLIHHGIIFVPLGYKNTFSEMSDLDVIHGGSPWGAGTFAGATGARFPSETELKVAYTQGKTFAETVLRSFPHDAGLNGKEHINLSTVASTPAPAASHPEAPHDPDTNEECYESTNEEHIPEELVEGPVTAVGPKAHNVDTPEEPQPAPGSPPGSPPANPVPAPAKAPAQPSAPAKADHETKKAEPAAATKKESGGCCKCM